ncbi:hypothetical protein CR513_42775, partial [Mucuna pruriens]
MTRQCYEASLEIRGQRVNLEKVGGTSSQETEHPQPANDLRKIQIGRRSTETTRIGARDVFAWALEELPRVDPDFLYHRISIIPGARCITQKKKERKMGDEKKRAIKKETGKLLVAHFIWEVHYPTWLANVVMVWKSNGH